MSTNIQPETSGLSLQAPFLISRSYLTTESNKTGSWRFLKPRYEDKTAPCGAACPTGEDIGRVEMLVARGLFKEAWETILLENPFPGVCGRVCFHPCERVCNRGEFDEVVSIHTIERFLADTAGRYDFKPDIERRPARKERIAVAGSGPSGLSAAWFLSRLGYSCDVFETMPEPGGLMRWGIPPYRLSRSALEKEISRIEAMGVRIFRGSAVTKDFIRQAAQSYDALFMGCGHGRSSQLGIPGEDLPGVEDGLSFLRHLIEGEAPQLGKGPVAIIGGGNTAVDVARSVVRLGRRALLIYRRRTEDMPAFEDEIRMAREEGAEIMDLLSPIGIQADGDGFLLALQRMRPAGDELSPLSPGGKPRIVAETGSIQTIRASRVFKAIGHEAAEDWIDPPKGSQQSSIVLSDIVLALPEEGGLPMVFGGDTAARLKSIVHAVASGKEAAMALDVLFREGPRAIRPKLREQTVGESPTLSMEIYMSGSRSRRSRHVVGYNEINADYFQFAPRIVQPRLLIEERMGSFAEIDLKISANLAMREAERCFNCGLCNQCDNCRLFCPDLAVKREESDRGRRIDYDYCKGCGICAVECPRNAITLGEE